MNKELIAQASSKLVLFQIAKRSSSFTINDKYNPPIDDFELSYQLRANLSRLSVMESEGAPSPVVRFDIETAIRLISGSPDEAEQLSDQEVLAELIATHSVYFYLNGEVPEEALREFGQYNATFQVWPYWREFVQSQFARAQIPVFSIPMFKANGEKCSVAPIKLATE